MKRTAWLLVGIGMAVAASAQSLDPILKKHVVNGRVDYHALVADPSPLSHYLKQAGKVPESEFNAWGEKRQLAFLINLYNASTLQLIVDRYPVKSIKKIKKGFTGPWDLPSVMLHGKRTTLNHLEHGSIPANAISIHASTWRSSVPPRCAARPTPPSGWTNSSTTRRGGYRCGLLVFF